MAPTFLLNLTALTRRKPCWSATRAIAPDINNYVYGLIIRRLANESTFSRFLQSVLDKSRKALENGKWLSLGDVSD